MPTSLWRLTVREEFSSAHALRHYQGKCESLHGHNYSVEMTVEGRTLTQNTEFVADFTTLKKILREELTKLDHKNLNDLSPFDTVNPTSENLARYLYQKLKQNLKDIPVRLYSVTVGETARQSATYMEE